MLKLRKTAQRQFKKVDLRKGSHVFIYDNFTGFRTDFFEAMEYAGLEYKIYGTVHNPDKLPWRDKYYAIHYEILN